MTRYYDAAMRAASGDEAARLWLASHAAQADGRATIIACDFDGTLCESDYPDILAPNAPLLCAVRMMREMGYEFILWTCRELDVLDDALAWLKTQGVDGLVVNDNCAAVKEMFDGYNSRKIFADEYWDDKAACAAMTGENAR